MGFWRKILGIPDRQQRDSALLIPQRPSRSPAADVTADSALRHSAVWACLRLRANLISTLPVGEFRTIGGVPVQMPKSPILVEPGGPGTDLHEWLYSSQVDLDRAGNAIGVITARTGYGLPARVELVDLESVTIRRDRDTGDWIYQIGSKAYPKSDIWHEKQYTVPGLPVGLSPVAYAAWSISQNLSAQNFGTRWFSDGGVPTGELVSRSRTLDRDQAAEAAAAFRAAVADRGLFVHGSEWEYRPIASAEVGQGFLEAQKVGAADICRFFDVPSDLVDAAQPGSTVTYANIGQRNTQLLILHLGPAIARRERALSRLVPSERFVRFDTDALLRMDPLTRATVTEKRIRSRIVTPTEVRLSEGLPPLTPDQLAELDFLTTPARSPDGDTDDQ